MNAPLDRPVVVVGAGRSGTTMIREALDAHPGLHACEYELNHLWRHGNAELAHDFLTPDAHFTPAIGEHVRRALAAELASQEGVRLVDKTVANVVRVAFVNAVLPDALFLHVIRDGRAVTASAMRRWRQQPGPGYLLSKGRTVPLTDVPRVAWRYLRRRVGAWTAGHAHATSWGPRWPGIDEDVARLPLAALCAKQWRISVAAARRQGSALGPGRYREIRYEALVRAPADGFREIAAWLGVDAEAGPFTTHVDGHIDAGRAERWRETLTGEDLDRAIAEFEPLLTELGYAE